MNKYAKVNLEIMIYQYAHAILIIMILHHMLVVKSIAKNVVHNVKIVLIMLLIVLLVKGKIII